MYEMITEDDHKVVLDLGLVHGNDSPEKDHYYLVECKVCSESRMVSKENFEEQELADSEE